MDMLEHALDGSDDKGDVEEVQLTDGQLDDEPTEEQAAAIASVTNQGTLTIDPTNLQYQFRADTAQGQVTYRVVQVAQDGTQSEAQVVSSAAFPAGAQVIQAPFSNGGSPTADLTGETKFTYIPAVSAVDGSEVTAANIGQVTTAGGEDGQFYVMMSPQDVLQGQRTIAPRTHTIASRTEGARSNRDERRRATHNEVERRRRDKINNWIVQLSKLVPDCSSEAVKAGQVMSNNSKGGILCKACDYITGLRTANARMAESLKDMEKLSVDVELLKQQCEELKQENSLLRAQMQQHGIVMPDLSSAS